MDTNAGKEREENMEKTPMGYAVGDKLMITARKLPVIITQCYLGSFGEWQIVLTNPISGHDVCRASEAEVRQYCCARA